MMKIHREKFQISNTFRSPLLFGLMVLNKYFFKKLPEKFGWESRWVESSYILQRRVFALLLLMQCFLRMKSINMICTYYAIILMEGSCEWELCSVSSSEIGSSTKKHGVWKYKPELPITQLITDFFFFLNFKALYLQTDTQNF